MKVILTICDSLRKSRALGKKTWKKVGSLLLKGFLKVFIVRTFSLDCLRLQQTKKYTRLYFYKENVSEIIDLTREAFQCFF